MAYDRFLIAPFESGLVTSITPWMIPDDAFELLKNAYVYKGIVRKRPGSRYLGYGAPTQFEQQLYSRLRINIGTTDGAGQIAGSVPGFKFEVGQMFSVDDDIFTVVELGTPGTMLSTYILSAFHTFNTTTGGYAIESQHLNTDVYFYPAEPVMGISHFEEGTINEHVTYAFDTQFSYVFNAGAWERSGTIVWEGDDTEFFWVANWQGLTPDVNSMFVSNYNATIGAPGATDDPLYTFDGTTWASYNPLYIAATGGDPDRYVKTARIIIPFKDRLLLLNTVEDSSDGTENEIFVNRCRYSHNGSPFPDSTAWIEAEGGGGFIDAPTSEEIISAEFIKDRVIVYFERSTWEIVYVYNFTSPFVWQKINTEVGSKSTFSSVAFDRAILTIGQAGIYACSGATVSKVNEKIDNFSDAIRIDNDGAARVHGIRDFFSELVYWTYPSISADVDSDTYPNRVLIYNYDNNTWGVADDCITAFGNFEQQTVNTWAVNFQIWAINIQIWDYALDQSNARRVIAGNQQGYTFIVDSETTTNASVMQITEAVLPLIPVGPLLTLTILNHTLNTGDYIRVENLTGLILAGDGIYRVTVIDEDTVTFLTGGINVGIYLGGGTAARVSRIDILSKQWNFYNDIASNVFVPKIDFCVDRTDAGEVTIDFGSSSSNRNLANDGRLTGTALGDNVLQTSAYDIVQLEQTQTRFWHPVYLQAEGENVQMRIYSSDEQMIDPDIQESDFRLEGMVVYAQRTASRFE